MQKLISVCILCVLLLGCSNSGNGVITNKQYDPPRVLVRYINGERIETKIPEAYWLTLDKNQNIVVTKEEYESVKIGDKYESH